MGGGERVAAVEGLQDPGDAAHLAVEIRAPVLRQRPQVLGRHPPIPLPLLPSRPQERGSKQRRPQGNPEMQEAAPLVVAGSKQVKKKKASSLAAPPHFPEEEVGDLTGDAPGRGRRSCLPDGEHQPIKKTSHQCCLSLSLSAKAPASR